MIVYSPDARLRTSVFSAVRATGRDLLKFRWQIWTTFRRDLKLKYTGTVFGVAWAFIQPVVPMSAYIALRAMRVFPDDATMHPVIYVSVGMTIWLLLASALKSPITALRKDRGIVATSRYPIACTMAGNLAQLVFETAVRLLVVVPAVLVFLGVPPLTLLLTPLLLIPALAMCVGAGALLAVANVAVPDISKLVDVALRYLVFISFGIFALPKTGTVGLLYRFNPFAVYVENIRSLAILGEMPDFDLYLWVSGISVLLFAYAAKVVYVVEDRIRGAIQ